MNANSETGRGWDSAEAAQAAREDLLDHARRHEAHAMRALTIADAQVSLRIAADMRDQAAEEISPEDPYSEAFDLFEEIRAGIVN